VTKSLEWGTRVNVQGYIQSANGGSSDETEDGWRDVQSGFGPGFDWQVDDKTMVLINFLHKRSDKEGQYNNYIFERGATRAIANGGKISERIKTAIDIGLDGEDETPNFGARFLWSISWK